MIAGYGIVGLAAATAISATLNCIMLYAVLHKRDWYRFTPELGSRILRQLVATAAMSALLWWLMGQMMPLFSADTFTRIWSLIVLVGGGMLVYFGTAYIVGAVDRERLNRISPSPVNTSSR